MLTNGTFDGLEAGRTYWLAYQCPFSGGTEIGCGPYLYTGRVDETGKYQFNSDIGMPPSHLFPGEITSVIDVDYPAEFRPSPDLSYADDVETQPTAANVGQLLEDEGLTYSVVYENSDRGEGFYTADQLVDGAQVIGVYVYPPGDEMQLATIAVVLDAYDLDFNRTSPGPDEGPFLVVRAEGGPA